MSWRIRIGKNAEYREAVNILREKLASAAKNALRVSLLDDGIGTYPEFMHEAVEERKRIESEDPITFMPVQKPHDVIGENDQLVPDMVKLALRQEIMENHKLTDEQLDMPYYSKYYGNWFRREHKRMVGHIEKVRKSIEGQTGLKTRAGVSFAVDQTNDLFTIPMIHLEGKISRRDFEKLKSRIPEEELMPQDKVVLGF